MAVLSRDAILRADDITPTLELVPVPEWGGDVHVGMMTGSQRDRFEDVYKNGKLKEYRALMAVMVVRDEAGHPLFTEADVPEVGKKSVAALDRIWQAAFRINRLGPEAVEDEAKNS